MLSLLGNSETAFAGLNSLNVNPLVYAEWNYNNITKPYVVYSTNTLSVSTASTLNTASSWSSVYSGTPQALLNGGDINEINTSGSAVLLNFANNLNSETFSCNVSLPSASGCYKIILYLKDKITNNSGKMKPIRQISASSISGGSTTGTVRYNILPVDLYCRRPMINMNTLISGSLSVTSALGASISWPEVPGAVAYDIYRSINDSSLIPFISTMPANYDNLLDKLNISNKTYVFNDIFSNTAKTISHQPSSTMKISVFPSIRLYNSTTSSYLTNFVCSSRVFLNDTQEPEQGTNSFELDGFRYYKVEIILGTSEVYDRLTLDLTVDAPYLGGGVLLCNAEMFKIDDWNIHNIQYYPIESPFQANRPGEALLHPYLQTKDRYVNYQQDSQNFKPTSAIFFNNDEFFDQKYSYPYKQAHNSIFNKFKYYLSPSNNDTSQVVVRAHYKNYLDINKIVIKVSNAIQDMTSVSGSIQVLGPNYSVLQTIPLPAGSFDLSGIAVAYFDGVGWSASSAAAGRGSWKPPTFTDSGIFQNVTSSVTGIVYITNQPPVSSTRASNTPASKSSRVHVLEISPRLELDVSGLVESFSVNKTLDDSDSVAGFPLGYMNSNQGDITLNNVPVYKNNFPFTIFDNISKSATISDIMREGVKFTVGLISPTNDFTDYVPFMTMYTDSWNIKDLDNISIHLYDQSQTFLQSQEAPEYVSTSEDVFKTITNILDICGFSDYDYDSLKNILNNRGNRNHAFYCDKKQTIFDVLKSFFIAYQIGAVFDEYGILRFYNIEDYIYQYTSNNFTPDFSISDIPLLLNKNSGSVYYEANLIKDSYTATIDKKWGEVVVDYSEPVRNLTEDNPDKNKPPTIYAKAGVTKNAVFTQLTPELLIRSFAGKSVSSHAKTMFVDNKLITSVEHVGNTVETTGTAFLQGELISWSGMEYIFSGSTGSKPMQPITRVLNNSLDAFSIAEEISSTNLSLTSLEWHPTGYLTGLRRGLKNTKIRNHIIFDDTTNRKNNYVSPSNNFTSYLLTGKTSRTTPKTNNAYGDSAVSFHNNIAKFVVNKPKASKKHLLALIPKYNAAMGDFAAPTSAKYFDYFSFVFIGPDLTTQKFVHDKSVIEIGFYINSAQPLMFGIRNIADQATGVAGKNHSYLVVNEFSTLGIKPKTSSGNDHPAHSAPFQKLGIDVFDGKPHRIGMWINYAESACYFYINKKTYGPFTIVPPQGKPLNQKSTNDWGVYVENLEKTFMNTATDEKSLTVFVTEMYAYDFTANGVCFINNSADHFQPDLKNFNFHWQDPLYLNQLVKNNLNAEPNYYFWGPLDLFGVKIYENVYYDTPPVLVNTTRIENIIGAGKDYTGYNETIGKTTIKDVAHSDIFSTPFRFSLMLVNNNKNNQMVWLAKGAEAAGPTVSAFAIEGDYLKFTDSLQVKKVINSSNLQATVTLSSAWIQTKEQAEKLLNKAIVFANSFNTSVNVEIFGNPLVQVGDVCKLVYTAKRIGYDPESNSVSDAYFLVKEVNQDFSGGLTTGLALRPLFNVSSTSLS
jgi:hypothetical protein